MTTDEYRKQCEWLAEFYKEAARTGRGIQMFNHGPRVWEDIDIGPNMRSRHDEWRLKPEPQKAWVVWANDWPCIVMTEQAAKNQTRMSGGTIQEITRPESQ